MTISSNNTAREFELPCFDGYKSFCGKAIVKEGASGEKTLKSYGVAVCKISPSGEFVRLWNGRTQTQTTTRHIRSFLRFYGIDEPKAKTK